MPVWLCQHSLRTWSWAALLAQRDALKPDAEVLAVSCLLHDVALLPYGRPPADLHCACFAVDGGQRSRLFLQAQAWAESRALVVEDAICLHMNPHVPLGAGIEAHLLQQAAALDVVGARMAAIDPATRQAVLARYPRTGFAQQMSEAMRQQAERAPRTRTRLLWRMGLERAIRRSAWRE
jgi:HD superfamily phosphodiesterase